MLLVGYSWQPQRVDFFPRRSTGPRWTDPESARLFRAGTRVTLVTAHPDDSEFYLAGTLTRLGREGARLTLVVVTDGDKAYQPFQDAERNRRTRRHEQDAAAKQWGATETVYLGRRDSRTRLTPALVAAIAAELKRTRPEYVVTLDAAYPPRVTHRDHLLVGRATTQAARQAGVGRWLLHASTRAPNFAFDVTGEWPRRWDLLHVHASQFSGWKRDRVHTLITRTAEADGRLLGVPFAEGLRCIRLPDSTEAPEDGRGQRP